MYVCTNTCISIYEYVYCIYSTLVKGWFGFEDLFAEGWIVVDVYNLCFFILCFNKSFNAMAVAHEVARVYKS